jgi:excisionase family DNA binding protein
MSMRLDTVCIRWHIEHTDNPPGTPDRDRTASVDKPDGTDGSRWLRPREAADLFGVDRRTLARWEEVGLLSAQRTAGRHRRFRESDVRALLAELGAVA